MPKLGKHAQGDVPLSRVLRLFLPYWARLTAVLVLIVFSSAVGIVWPFLLREILDVALPERRAVLLTELAGGMIAVVAVSAAISVLQSYWALMVGQAVMNDLRNSVYSHLQRLSLSWFTKTRTGEVQSRIANDIGGMSATVTNVATTIISALTTVIGSVVAMFALSWQLTAVSLAMLPVFAWISRNVGSERRVITMQRQKQYALMSSTVEESLSVGGFLLGRVMGRTDALNDAFAAQSKALTSLTIRSSMAGRWRQSSINVILSGMPVVIYWTTGMAGSHGRPLISIGTLVAFTSLQQRLFNPAVALLQAGITVRSSLALFERVFEYIDMPVDIAEPVHPVLLGRPRGHVRFSNVSFAHGDQQVLHDIHIDLPPGKHVAVIGPTGAGKTTLGYLVPRLYDVTAGCVTIDGVDVRDLSFSSLAAMVGVVFQDTYLFHASVAENLRFAKPDATDAELIAAARAAQIHELIAELPEGYDTTVGERGYRFSGGERQRLAIARVLLRNPPVLLLDEATSALDTRTESAIQQALDMLSAGRTTITIAHRLSTIRDADEIIVLGNGRITERGTHAQLQALGGYYAGHAAGGGSRVAPLSRP